MIKRNRSRRDKSPSLFAKLSNNLSLFVALFCASLLTKEHFDDKSKESLSRFSAPVLQDSIVENDVEKSGEIELPSKRRGKEIDMSLFPDEEKEKTESPEKSGFWNKIWGFFKSEKGDSPDNPLPMAPPVFSETPVVTVETPNPYTEIKKSVAMQTEVVEKGANGLILNEEEVQKLLDEKAKLLHPPDLSNWGNSIVDLLKVLEKESNLNYRKDLGKEYGVEEKSNIQFNIKLHEQVLEKVKKGELRI